MRNYKSKRKHKHITRRTLTVKEVFTLEEILEDNLGFKNVFRSDGTLTIMGELAYELLVQLIINLSHIGVCRPSEASKMLYRLEKILHEPDVELDD